MGWYGVDFDGTLALHPDPERPWPECGRPIQKMVDRVKAWLANGDEVRIVSARFTSDQSQIGRRGHIARVQAWCLEQFGQVLILTDRKDFGMVELWDDRAVQIISNTGERADGQD